MFGIIFFFEDFFLSSSSSSIISYATELVKIIFFIDLSPSSPAIHSKLDIGFWQWETKKLRPLCHQLVSPHPGMVVCGRTEDLFLLTVRSCSESHTCWQTLGPSTPCISPFPCIWPSSPELLLPLYISTITAHTGCGPRLHCLRSGSETAQCSHHLGLAGPSGTTGRSSPLQMLWLPQQWGRILWVCSVRPHGDKRSERRPGATD